MAGGAYLYRVTKGYVALSILKKCPRGHLVDREEQVASLKTLY